MASNEFDLYSFRKAASMYFGVAYPVKVSKKPRLVKKSSVVKTSTTTPKKVIPKKKKKKMPVEGGC